MAHERNLCLVQAESCVEIAWPRIGGRSALISLLVGQEHFRRTTLLQDVEDAALRGIRETLRREEDRTVRLAQLLEPLHNFGSEDGMAEHHRRLVQHQQGRLAMKRLMEAPK